MFFLSDRVSAHRKERTASSTSMAMPAACARSLHAGPCLAELPCFFVGFWSPKTGVYEKPRNERFGAFFSGVGSIFTPESHL